VLRRPLESGEWSDLLEAISASNELELDPQQVLEAFKSLEQWTAGCREAISATNSRLEKQIDAVDSEAAEAIADIARIVTSIRRDAASAEAVLQLQSQVEELEGRLKGALKLHAAVVEQLENSLPVSQVPQRTRSSMSSQDGAPR